MSDQHGCQQSDQDGEQSDAPRRRPPDEIRRRRIVGAALVVVVLAAWAVLRHAGIFFNVTPSLPPGLYRHAGGTPGLGDVAAACLDERASALALVRGYVAHGACPHETAPVAKVVAAVAGDTVRLSPRGLRIRGVLLPNSAPRAVDGQGYPMPDWTGTYVLGADEVWLYSGYTARSFDARYFGPLLRSYLQGRVVPVWTWGDPYDPAAALEGIATRETLSPAAEAPVR